MSHLAPQNCFICGWAPEHHSGNSHNFWSNADAMAEADRHDRRIRVPSQEADYVAQHRPY